MRIAIQMDPIGSINPASDSTILLAHGAQVRGHEIWHYTPDALSYSSDGSLSAQAQPFAVHSLGAQWQYTLGEAARLDLRSADVILLRQDPPFDMAYITSTFMLESLARPGAKKAPLIVNDQFQVRKHPDKLFPLAFPDLVPPTLISRDLAELKAFRAAHGDIVLKPLYGFGGKSVFHIGQRDMNFYSFLEMAFEYTKEPIIAQRFIPEVKDAEKRIVIIDDFIAPAMNRVPPQGEIRSNLRIGGEGRKIELTQKQRTIAERLVPELQKRGLLLVGLDMIGDFVTEINVTSPTGLRWINAAYDVKLEDVFWDKVEAKL